MVDLVFTISPKEGGWFQMAMPLTEGNKSSQVNPPPRTHRSKGLGLDGNFEAGGQITPLVVNETRRYTLFDKMLTQQMWNDHCLLRPTVLKPKMRRANIIFHE